MATKRLALRRPDRCTVCAADPPAGTVAVWDSTARTVTCQGCADQPHRTGVDESAPADLDPIAEPVLADLDRGQPGRSLAREYERRRAARERRTRERHPRIGGLLLALGGEPQHQAAFHQGAQGEQAVAESLEKRTADGPAIMLHNRRMPGGRGDIDHIAITPSGVFVIDAKDVAGRVEIQRPWFGQPKLLISGRDRTKYIDGLDRQVAATRHALTAAGHEEVAVQGVLCFTKADLPLIGTLEMRGHLLLYRKALAKRLTASGPHDTAAIDALAQCLAAALQAA